MTRPQAPINRFSVSPDYSIFYRKTNHFEWQNQVTADYAVISVLSGELTCLINEQTTQLEPSQSLVIEPNLSISADGKAIEFLFLTFSPSLAIEHAIAMKLIAPKSTITFARNRIEGDAKLNHLFENFVNELIEEKPGKDIVMRALVKQALVHVLRNYSTTRRSDELELSRVGLVDRRIRRSVELMHAQLDQDLSLKALAGASYLSPFHFSRLFKKLTGATPHNYLAAIRATRAQLLLAETEMSITEIGTRVGYLSASHFTKAFRLATGTTPREFRKALIDSSK
jgi:AraC family transcriptional regulator